MPDAFRLALIAPKNSAQEKEWLLSFLCRVQVETYRRGSRYDMVWMLNVTDEIRFIKANTDTKVILFGMEPEFKYPSNYDASLLSLADVYSAYRNFAGSGFDGTFLPFTFPVYPRGVIRREMPASMTSERDLDFCIFATHDPNIRGRIGDAIGGHPSLKAGPLFGNRISEKLPAQRHCRYEFITENDINDYYFSEKLGESLVAGCVPVYYGCTEVKKHVPPEFFIDMHDFARIDGHPDVDAVVAHCLSPGVYEAHRTAIESGAMAFLQERFSLEHCLTDPVQHYADELRAQGWRAKSRSWRWRYWSCRQRLKTFAGRD